MRMENGRTALVRAGRIVHVSETGVLRAADVVAILRQAGLSPDEFLDLLCVAKDRSTPPTNSGFYVKNVDAVVADAATVRTSGEEIRERVEAAIEASRAARTRLERPIVPDSTRVRCALRRARAEAAATVSDRKRGQK